MQGARGAEGRGRWTMTHPNCLLRRNFREIGLYLAVGLIGLGIDSAVFFSLLSGGFGVLVSQWTGAGIGALHNSLWHHYAVFDHDKKLRHTVGPNVAISLGTVAISGPLLLFLGTVSGDIILSKILVLGVTTFGTYFLRKLLVFRRESI